MSETDGGIDVATQLREIAAYLIEVAEGPKTEGFSVQRSAIPLRRAIESDDLPALAFLAQEELRERTRRYKEFDCELLGEPVWDILLDLFVARVCGRRISVTSACIASNVPPSTALRWLGAMEANGLICRTDDEYDRRRTWVALSDSAFWKLVAYLRSRSSQRDAQLVIPAHRRTLST